MSEQKIKKELPIEIKEANDKDRTITAIISKEVIDRDGDVISVKGINAKHWKANAVVLADHANSVENVIGKGVGKKFWVSGDEALIKFELATEKVNPKAEMVFQMYKGGFLKTMSLSFIPNWDKVAYADDAKKAGAPKGTQRLFNEVEMIEATVTPLPANRAAFMKSANDAWEAGVLDGIQLNIAEDMYPEEEETKQVNEDNDIKAIEMAAEEKSSQDEMEELLKQVNDRDTKIMELELQLKEQQMEEEEQEFDSYLAEMFGEFNQANSSESEADVEQTDDWAGEILTIIEEDE